jgi:hypothetical protein
VGYSYISIEDYLNGAPILFAYQFIYMHMEQGVNVLVLEIICPYDCIIIHQHFFHYTDKQLIGTDCRNVVLKDKNDKCKL